MFVHLNNYYIKKDLVMTFHYIPHAETARINDVDIRPVSEDEFEAFKRTLISIPKPRSGSNGKSKQK
jgi:hypothetical protein